MNAVAQNIDDRIDDLLAYYRGDVRAAIQALLDERDFLIHEIEIASLAMSYGYARGWKPKIFDR